MSFAGTSLDATTSIVIVAPPTTKSKDVPLGAGGMGEVYRARDAKLGRDVAVKVLPERLAADEAALQRFEREARAVAALSHPNVLSIFDYGVLDGTAYAVMELLEGESLRAA